MMMMFRDRTGIQVFIFTFGITNSTGYSSLAAYRDVSLWQSLRSVPVRILELGTAIHDDVSR
jgi:hypothetical protein